MTEFAEIARDEGIDRGNVGGGNSYVLAGKHQKEMFEIVFGEDGDGAGFAEAAIEEGLADTVDGLQNLGVGEFAPFAVPFPFGYTHIVR